MQSSRYRPLLFLLVLGVWLVMIKKNLFFAITFEPLHTGPEVVNKQISELTELKIVSKDLGRSSDKIQGNFFGQFANLGVMPKKAENTFSPLHIPVLVKSKNIFCHFVQIFMGILEICVPTFQVQILPFYSILKNKI